MAQFNATLQSHTGSPLYKVAVSENGAKLAELSICLPEGGTEAEAVALAQERFAAPAVTYPTGPFDIDVDGERDRRLAVFPYDGHLFDFDAASQTNIQGAFSIAMAAVLAGAEVGNLRWSDPGYDFSWITVDNQIVPMDAHQVVAFGKAAAAWKSAHIFKARALKDQQPIPADYKADANWPTG